MSELKPEDVEALAALLAPHDGYRVSGDGWTVCICGYVLDGDEDDGSHASHVAFKVAPTVAAMLDQARAEGAAAVVADVEAVRVRAVLARNTPSEATEGPSEARGGAGGVRA